MSKAPNSANYGIVGNVNATAVAVGPRARAVVNQGPPASRAELDAVLAAIRSQIASLPLADDQRAAAHADLAQVETIAGATPEPKKGAAEILNRLVKTIQSGGALLQTVAGLHGPLQQLASWFHVALPF